MSAFIVSKEHIDAMLTAGLMLDEWTPLSWYPKSPREYAGLGDLQRARRELRADTADEVGAMLWAENVRSVQHRYPDTIEGGEYPGPVGFAAGDVFAYSFQWVPDGPRDRMALVTLKAIACYEYQSCGHPEWEGSEAERFCDALRRTCVASLPGFDDAPGWEITDRRAFAAQGVS